MAVAVIAIVAIIVVTTIFSVSAIISILGVSAVFAIAIVIAILLLRQVDAVYHYADVGQFVFGMQCVDEFEILFRRVIGTTNVYRKVRNSTHLQCVGNQSHGRGVDNHIVVRMFELANDVV